VTESIDGEAAAAGKAVADGAAPGGMRSARVLGLPHAGADGSGAAGS